ncbi:deubiquitinating protein VCIP135-like isoform X2 [Pomacea canaliculata]|uniref:deubiquitinating protein VCIP135-like isoform X2 n=1 Tax=Pomacea canaliculata TaxID=400727 RepID=UPI000D738C79|nr:deubiquitinating protein VCIP135-like isoform X2 [Pomacea canaliculata]
MDDLEEFSGNNSVISIICIMPHSDNQPSPLSNSPDTSDKHHILCGVCPDPQCQTKLHFLSTSSSVECTGCGQRHDKSTLLSIMEAPTSAGTFQNLLQSLLMSTVKPHRGPDNVKVLGLSNYMCKLLSPVLSRYGMDRQTGRAKLLTEMGQGEIFDCGNLSDRAFLLDSEHVNIEGFGRDPSSAAYLADTLEAVKKVNDDDERLIPIYADGDGHCLVHAVSRALVGRELFWHALRLNLMHHLQDNLEKYELLFENFVDKDEWKEIIEECDPNFMPKDHEPAGLRNIHIFGLANVLKRPIILLDTLGGMQSSGDYSGVFLPALVEPEKCCGKDGVLNKPICVAWSSQGRNHFISLVGVKGKPCPRLPRYMIQRAWGVSSSMVDKYIHFEDDQLCAIGGEKCLQDRYLQRLVTAMEEVFYNLHGVHPSLVADVHQYSFKSQGIDVGKTERAVEETKQFVQDGQLLRCLICKALTHFPMPRNAFVKGGALYQLALDTHHELLPSELYKFPKYYDITCHYDKVKDELIPDISQLSCPFCRGLQVRPVKADGTIEYKNGDRTIVPTNSKAGCGCGFKHYWDGQLYDNQPELLTVPLEWNNKKVEERVAWFQHETDPQLNSNVYQVAENLVQKHFPGEFGSERLVQQVVDTILRQTASSKTDDVESPHVGAPKSCDHGSWTADEESKIILSGAGIQKRSLHKEELNKSETEQQLRHRVSANAPLQQTRSKSVESSTGPSGKTSPQTSPHRSGAAKEARGSPDLSATSSAKSTPSATPPSTPKSTAHGGKTVRVTSSTGQAAMLTLNKELTFWELQQKLEEALGVPPHRQKLRVGFPPRELKAPAAGEEGRFVPINHGDKIVVEVLSEPSLVADAASRPVDSDQAGGQWGLFDWKEQMPHSESLIEHLRDSQHLGDSIDSAIISLGLIATMSGKDLWTYVQKEPHLFSVGGLFYKQVERDLGLTPNKHCTLPALPGKVFRYNDVEDRLELCLEPHGHFPVQPEIEKLVRSGMIPHDVHSSVSDEAGQGKFGSSSALGSGCITHTHGSHKAFSGQGHSLRSAAVNETRMPADLPMTSHKHEARRLHNFCDPAHAQESIEEVPEVDNSDLKEELACGAEPGKAQEMYLRKGPGFSVLKPQSVPEASTDALLQLTRQIKEAIGSDTDTEIMECVMEQANEEQAEHRAPLAWPHSSAGESTTEDGTEKSKETEENRADDSATLVPDSDQKSTQEIIKTVRGARTWSTWMGWQNKAVIYWLHPCLTRHHNRHLLYPCFRM